MATFPRIPINPRLTFGEPIEKVCTRGRLHPGLKELFTKAYFSAHLNECFFYDDSSVEDNISSPGAWILTILKFGQGDVCMRLSLKRRLETGRWLMPLQVPPAAPLWLIRHFLGRLHTPLVFCLTAGNGELEIYKKKWIQLSKDCHAAMYHHMFNQKIHLAIQRKIAQVMDEMQLEACLTLISLITLIRNLSYEPSNGHIDKKAVQVLLDYFVPALISRPYRPGYLTKEDQKYCTGLSYLCHSLPEIQALCKRPETSNNLHLILDSSSGASILDLHKSRGAYLDTKRATSEDLNTPPSKTDSDKIPNNCDSSSAVNVVVSDQNTLVSKEEIPESDSLRRPQLLSTNDCATKKSEDECKIEEVQRGTTISSYVTQQTKDEDKCVRDLNDYELNHENLEENVTNLKITEGAINKDFQVIFQQKDDEESKISETNVLEHTRIIEKNAMESNLERKCQAIKLAYKLRGQWLAWRLAGIFLDGATSHIPGFGYTKLPDDEGHLLNL